MWYHINLWLKLIYDYNYQGNVRKYKQYQIHDMYSHGSSNTVIRRDDTWSTFINMHSSVLLLLVWL